jgi:hypothetical protein
LGQAVEGNEVSGGSDQGEGAGGDGDVSSAAEPAEGSAGLLGNAALGDAEGGAPLRLEQSEQSDEGSPESDDEEDEDDGDDDDDDEEESNDDDEEEGLQGSEEAEAAEAAGEGGAVGVGVPPSRACLFDDQPPSDAVSIFSSQNAKLCASTAHWQLWTGLPNLC